MKLGNGLINESTLLSIKEFSDFTGVKQSTLRYYDDIGLLPAASRGEENNYRYYAPFQIITLNYINVLIDLDVPLSVVMEMNEIRTPENVINLLNQQEVKLDKQMNELRMAYSIIHTVRDNIHEGLVTKGEDLSVKWLDESYVVLGPKNDFSKTDVFYEPFIAFCNSAAKHRINLRYPIGGYHDSFEAFLASPGKPDNFYSQDPFGNMKCEAGEYLVGHHIGYYGSFGDLPERMDTYAKEHGLQFNGPLYAIYLLDEISVIPPDKYLSRVMVGVTKKWRV